MLRVKLPYMEAETTRRQQIAQAYRSGITNPLVTLPNVIDELAHVGTCLLCAVSNVKHCKLI